MALTEKQISSFSSSIKTVPEKYGNDNSSKSNGNEKETGKDDNGLLSRQKNEELRISLDKDEEEKKITRKI